MLLARHAPDPPEQWTKQQLEAGTIRYGWLVNKQFKERAP